MASVLIISFSDLGRDPRVDRQISFLHPEHQIIAAGIGPPTYPDVEFIDLTPPVAGPKLSALARRGSSLALILGHQYDSVYWRHPANRFAFERVSNSGADLIVANDLPALPLACRVAAGAPVIFDAHEFAVDEFGHAAWWRAVMAPYVDGLLRTYLPQISGMMTVGPGIARLYADRYGVEPVVVTNAPPLKDLSPTPTATPIRMIHHGAAQPERQLELMIDAVDLLDDRFELDLMLLPTDRAYFSRLKRLVDARSSVRMVDAVSQREIVERCHEYDIGVFLLPARSDNQLYVLPNKLFEFIQARLAIAIGPSPEMARIVREHECGIVANDFTAPALADALRPLSCHEISRYKGGADRAAGELNAERNREIVVKLVDDAVTSRGSAVRRR